jgi:putative two-component system response regulator
MLDNITILVVDDLELNLAMMRNILSDLGELDYMEARNGLEALKILQHTPDIDIVLLDLEMPLMNGFELLRMMKQHDDFREIAVIVITSNKTEVNKTLAMGANDFMAKPYDPEELKLRVMNQVRSKKLGELARDLNSALEGEVVRKTSALRRALDLSRKAEFEISLRLGRAAEFRDLETGMHIRRVSEFSHELVLLAGMEEQECEILRHASPLHDVGKIGVPDNILRKPGKLEAFEFQIMKTHTTIGGKILSDADEFPVIKAGQIIALQHHEKWDGSGYPLGLAGPNIHIYGRIVMIADVFDALTSERPYKKAFPIENALEIMMDGKGTFFDPALLELFTENLDAFIGIREAYRDVDEPGTESDSVGAYFVSPHQHQQ